jgi:hypothetical protein
MIASPITADETEVPSAEAILKLLFARHEPQPSLEQQRILTTWTIRSWRPTLNCQHVASGMPPIPSGVAEESLVQIPFCAASCDVWPKELVNREPGTGKDEYEWCRERAS